MRVETVSPNKFLNIATSSRPTPTSNLDPRIKCLGCGLYDFVYKDGTFAEWLRKNLYLDDNAKDPIVYVEKDPLIKEAKKTSGKRNPSTHEITNPSAMFIRQVIIKNTVEQTSVVDEILARKVI